MALVSEKNIQKISFLYATIVVTGLTLLTGGLFIYNKIQTLEKELVQAEQEFIDRQKEALKRDVTGLVNRLEVRRQSLLAQMERRLQERANQVQDMVAGMYREMLGRFSTADIEQTIAAAIRAIRFNDKHGYFFVIRQDGEAVVYPADPAAEGTNFLSGAGGESPETVAALIRIASAGTGGFYRYSWPKPGGDATPYPKVSYVSRFKPLDWVIGTGEYLDDLEGFARQALLQELRETLANQQTDYYFAYDLHDVSGGSEFATMLINSNRPDLVGQKISDDYRDARGKEFRKEFLAGIRSNAEAFVVYWYKKPDGSGSGRKLSYFKLYPEWNWVFARGIYFDRLDDTIASMKTEIRRRVRDDIVLLALVFTAALAVALVVAFYFSRGLQRIFDNYHHTQQQHLVKLRELNRDLERQSRTDALTGANNRGYFNSQFSREVVRAQRYGSPLSLVILDIDDFKQINDRHGHLAGDQVLREISGVLSDNIRRSDLLARWGGEEFAILAPGIDLGQALQFAEKLRLTVASREFAFGEQVTCSFGVADYHPPEAEDTFLQRADTALYQAKTGGKNRCLSIA